MLIKDEKGGALIEFSIIAPLLFVILFGIVEFGLVLYNQAVITNASREGARYGIVAKSPRWEEGDILKDAVLPVCGNLITFGNTNNPIVKAVHLDGTTLFGDNLEVQVSWDYTFLVLPNLPKVGLTNPITLSARTVMKYE
jgi:Flp pilus assembly protein TadG